MNGTKFLFQTAISLFRPNPALYLVPGLGAVLVRWQTRAGIGTGRSVGAFPSPNTGERGPDFHPAPAGDGIFAPSPSVQKCGTTDCGSLSRLRHGHNPYAGYRTDSEKVRPWRRSLKQPPFRTRKAATLHVNRMKSAFTRCDTRPPPCSRLLVYQMP